MKKRLKFKAVEVLRNNHKLAQRYVSFRTNYKFSIYDRFEWSRIIKEWSSSLRRQKYLKVYKESDCDSPCNEAF